MSVDTEKINFLNSCDNIITATKTMLNAPIDNRNIITNRNVNRIGALDI